MTGGDLLAVLLAGVGAGTINTIVGSGTLITFPVLVLLGMTPVEANVSSTVGLVPGALSGAIGYRRELTGQRRRLVGLAGPAVGGGVVGGVLLLVLPASAFDAIVPVLILVALGAVVFQPRLAGWMAARGAARSAGHTVGHGNVAAEAGPRASLWFGVAVTGIYGGYFGAAQGVLMLALLAILIQDDLQRLNAAKNVLSLLVNGVAALLFAVVADVNWRVAALVAIGSALGGQLGARIGRRLSARVLRGIVVAVGLVAVVQLLRP